MKREVEVTKTTDARNVCVDGVRLLRRIGMLVLMGE